jgi:hypothetical protein
MNTHLLSFILFKYMIYNDFNFIRRMRDQHT